MCPILERFESLGFENKVVETRQRYKAQPVQKNFPVSQNVLIITNSLFNRFVYSLNDESLAASLVFNGGWLFSAVHWLNNLSLKIHCLSREQGASKAWQDGRPPLPMSAINARGGWLVEPAGPPASLWNCRGAGRERERGWETERW